MQLATLLQVSSESLKVAAAAVVATPCIYIYSQGSLFMHTLQSVQNEMRVEASFQTSSGKRAKPGDPFHYCQPYTTVLEMPSGYGSSWAIHLNCRDAEIIRVTHGR